MEPVAVSRCWAAVLGGCSSKMSGEHLVSRNQYGDDTETITVQGLPWCPQPKVIGLASAVAKILCEKHNHALSPADGAAKDVLRALSLMRDRSEDKMPPLQFPMRRFTASGDLFERWLLKTTINVAMVGKPRPEAGIFEAGGLVARRYVEIAFGLGQFDLDEGVYWVAKVGDQIQNRDLRSFAVRTWTLKSDGGLVAAQVRYHGYHLWLATRGAPAIQNALRLRTLKADNVAVEINLTWSRQLPGPPGES
jgi:hypothetical protein